jgi:acyl carrier protein
METMPPEIMQTISTYISTQILKQPNRVLKPEEPLLSNGLVDSFSLVDLSLFIEKQFNVAIDDTELNPQTFDTLAQLVALVQSRL